MNFSEEEKEAYEDHLKWLRIETNTLKKAEAKGRAEGKAEEKIAIARARLKEGSDLNFISKVKKLNLEAVNKLKDQ